MKKNIHKKEIIFISLLLIGITLTVYWQVGDFEFLNMDDTTFVTENRHVQAGLTFDGIRYIFSNPSYFCMQLSFLSHMLDCELFGMDPGWHHLTNLFFHLMNTVLLFVILNRMTGTLWRSAFVAAVFAIHPLNVESVAWVAERRNVLSAFFWFLAMLTYIRFVRRPNISGYLFIIVFFILGLMSKAIVVTLPFVLLLLDYWPLRRHAFFSEELKIDDSGKTAADNPRQSLRNLIIEKIPLFAVSFAASILTLIAARNPGDTAGIGGLASLDDLPLNFRLMNSVVNYVKYIGKMFYPSELAIPYMDAGLYPLWQVIGASLILISVTFMAIKTIKQYPYFIVGWLWYLGTLFPVNGLVKIGIQSIADRYAYIPLIGLFIIIAWGGFECLAKWRYKKLVPTAVFIVILFLSIQAWKQVGYWRNNITLFEHSLKVIPQSFFSHNNLAVALNDKGQIEKSIHHFQKAIRLKPDYARAHFGLGAALVKQGQVEKGIRHYQEAIRIKPDYAEVHNNLGVLLDKQGLTDEAIFHYFQALKIEPDLADANNNLGMTLFRQGRFEDAIYYYSKALAVEPKLAETHNNMGIALIRIGDFERAIVSFKAALRIRPYDGGIKENIDKLNAIMNGNE